MGDEFEVLGRFDAEDDLTPKLDNMAAGFQRVVSAAEYMAETFGKVDESLLALSGPTADIGAKLANGFQIAVPVVDEFGNVLRTLTLSFDAFGNAVTTGSLALDGFGRNTLSVAETQARLIASFAEEEAALTGLDNALTRDERFELNVQTAALGVMDAMKQAALATWQNEEAFIKIDEMVGRYNDTLAVTESKLRTFADMSAGVSREQTALAESAIKATQAEIDLGTAAGEAAGKFTDLGLIWDKASIGASALATEEQKVAAATTQVADATAKIVLSAEEASMAVAKLDEALAGTTLMTRAEVDALQALAGSFVAGNITLKEFMASQFSEAQILQELVRQLINGAVSMKELADAGVNLDAVNAVLTNMDAKMGLLAASTKAAADGLALVGDAGLAAGGKTSTGMVAAGTAVEGAGLKAQASALMFGNLGKEMEGVGGISQFLLFTLGMMAVGAGQQMLDMGLTSDDALKRIQLQTGVTDAQMQTWDNTIRDLGSHWGFTLTEAAQGLDLVTRAAFRGTDATNVLNQGMVLAVDTGSSLADSTNLLLMSMKSYGAGADQAANYTNILNDTFKNSRLTVPELTSLMGNAMPIAVGLGISLKDLGNAVSIFSQSTASGMIATRDFQAMLVGMSSFTELDTAALAKLAGSFDLTKFSTMDFTAKLGALAAASQGNEATFTNLIGGTNNAKTAMDNLDISTKQLAINAANLGVSFDPVRYNSLDAAGKLLYLMGIVNDSGPKFAKLTDGVAGTNTALSELGSAMDKSGQHLADMGTHFDMAKFKAADMAQQLYAMADFFGGDGTAAFIKYIGGEKNLTEAHQIMATEVDKHIETSVGDQQVKDTTKHVDDLSAHWQITKEKLAQRTQVGDVDTKPYTDAEAQARALADDNKHQMDRIKADWSSAADEMVRVVAPHIIDALHGIGKELNAGNADNFGKKDLMTFLFGDWQHEDEKFRSMMSHMTTDFMTWRTGIDSAFNQWRLSFDDGFRQLATNVGTSISQWRLNMDNGFRQGFTGALNALNTWRSDMDNGFRQLATNVGTSISQWRLNMDNGFRQGFTDVITSLNQWRTNFDQGFRQGTTDVINIVNTWRLGMDQSFRQLATDITHIVSQARLDIDQSFRQGVTDWENTIKTGLDHIKQLFTDLSQNLVGGSIVPDMVSAITRTFTQGGTDWLTPITTFITTAESDFTTASATLTAIAGEIGANVNSAFVTAGAVWNSTVGAAMATVIATVQSWVGAATSAGAAVGNAIGNGLQSAVGWVTQAANNVAGAIAGIFQHLSPPKEGPLHTDDQWMPNMVKMMASGITDNTGTLRQAAITAATSITMPLQSVSQTQFVQSTGSTATDMTPVVQILVQIYQVLRTQQMQGPATGGQSSIRGNVSQQQMLASLYQMLNGYGGFTFESGSRGAYAGLGV